MSRNQDPPSLSGLEEIHHCQLAHIFRVSQDRYTLPCRIFIAWILTRPSNCVQLHHTTERDPFSNWLLFFTRKQQKRSDMFTWTARSCDNIFRMARLDLLWIYELERNVFFAGRCDFLRDCWRARNPNVNIRGWDKNVPIGFIVSLKKMGINLCIGKRVAEYIMAGRVFYQFNERTGGIVNVAEMNTD